MRIFSVFERLSRRIGLMDRMMDAVGVTDQFKTLPNAAEVLRRASSRCRHCSNAGDCKAMLDANEIFDEAPDFCRNHDLFNRLKREIAN